MSRHKKQGQVSWEECRDAARLCRYGVRKAKDQLELNLARYAKKNKESFYKCINQEEKAQEGIPHLENNTGNLVTTD